MDRCREGRNKLFVTDNSLLYYQVKFITVDESETANNTKNATDKEKYQSQKGGVEHEDEVFAMDISETTTTHTHTENEPDSTVNVTESGSNINSHSSFISYTPPNFPEK